MIKYLLLIATILLSSCQMYDKPESWAMYYKEQCVVCEWGEQGGK